jgi:hypothetical protein
MYSIELNEFRNLEANCSGLFEDTPFSQNFTEDKKCKVVLALAMVVSREEEV